MGFAQTIQGFPVPLLATTLPPVGTTLPPVGKSAPLERRSRTCRHSSLSDRLATLKSPPVTGKELCGRTGGKARRPSWVSALPMGNLGLDRDDRLRGGLAPGE